jgi:folate-binding protein YgfZ
MIDTDNAESVFAALHGHDVLAIDGPDAASFLQAQLASDVATLAPGDWQWSSWLSAQGRVLALMLLLRSGTEAFHAVVSHGRGAELAARLQRFVLRARVRILVPGLHASGATLAGDHGPQSLRQRGSARGSGTDWVLALGGTRSRRLRIGVVAGISDPSLAWARADIDEGVPWIAAAVSDREIPQALGLARLAAFSVHKGCYPGQEIVARTHFLGRSKRRLLRFQADTAWMPDPGADLVSADGAASALVISALRDGPAIAGLVVLRGETARRFAGPSGESLSLAELPAALPDDGKAPMIVI